MQARDYQKPLSSFRSEDSPKRASIIHRTTKPNVQESAKWGSPGKTCTPRRSACRCAGGVPRRCPRARRRRVESSRAAPSGRTTPGWQQLGLPRRSAPMGREAGERATLARRRARRSWPRFVPACRGRLRGSARRRARRLHRTGDV